jgi:hypothetical protein
MIMSTLSKAFTLLLLLSFASLANAQSPQQITDEELTKYVAILKEVTTINQDSRQQMTDIITSEGLEVPRFNAIYRSQQNPDQQVEVTEDEQKRYEAAMKRIDQLQELSKKRIDDEVLKAGLTLERYNEMNAIIEKDGSLQQKIISKMRE